MSQLLWNCSSGLNDIFVFLFSLPTFVASMNLSQYNDYLIKEQTASEFQKMDQICKQVKLRAFSRLKGADMYGGRAHCSHHCGFDDGTDDSLILLCIMFLQVKDIWVTHILRKRNNDSKTVDELSSTYKSSKSWCHFSCPLIIAAASP